MKRKFVVYKNGIRYWATKFRFRNGRVGVKFWSSHEWPFYHGSYCPDAFNRDDCYRKFLEWIPA